MHLVTPTGEKPSQCSQCGKTFKQKISLKLSEDTYIIGINISMLFKEKLNFVKHQRIHNSRDDKDR